MNNRPATLDDRIDAACDQFEQNWSSPQPFSIETILQDFEPAHRAEVFEELFAVELELRFARGDRLEKAEYLSRHSQYSAIVSDLFDSSLEKLFATSADSSDLAKPHAKSAKPDMGTCDSLPAAIGKYRIIDRLDNGGQATVFRALHPELGRDVVIKFCHVDSVTQPQAQEALKREGKVLARLSHPNLAQVYDFDFHEGRAYLVIELIKGRNLWQVARQKGLQLDDGLRLVQQLASALEYVHSQGVLHLDLKPQNVLIDEHGNARLIDFGLARTETAWQQAGTAPDALCGTLAYMAPEQAQCRADLIGPQTDVFGLGGVIYFVATGQPPIIGNSVSALLSEASQGKWNRHLLAEAQCPELLKKIIENALATELSQRTASAKILKEQLQQFTLTAKLQSDTARLDAPTRPYLRRILVAAFCGAVICAVSMLILLMWKPPGNANSDASIGPMQIRVWRAGDVFDLVNSIPLSNDDRIEIRAQIPAHLNLLLFAFDSEGRLTLVDWLPPTQEKYLYRYPRNSSDFESIAGRSGTELLFLCCSEQPLQLADVQAWGHFDRPWPKLPNDSLIQVRSDTTSYEVESRSLGGAVETLDPQQLVFDKLESLRKHASQFKISIEGLAFPHSQE